jgi:hypothetical protein
MDELDILTPASLATFVPRWYGPPDRPVSTRPLPPALPAPLAAWHRLADRWTLPLSRDHVMKSPDSIDTDDSRAVFWHSPDNSDVYAFGPDELVYERTGTATWQSTGVTLDRFLVYTAVYEAVYAPLHGLVLLDNPVGDILDHRLVPLADPLWTWVGDGSTWYADDDLLAHATRDRVVVAARHRDALGRFDGYDITWDWDSREA